MSNNFIKSNQFSTIVSNLNKSLLYYRAKNLPPKRKNKKFSYQDQSFKTKFEGIILKKDYYVQNFFIENRKNLPLQLEIVIIAVINTIRSKLFYELKINN